MFRRWFLGANKHLYKWVCPSVRPSVRLSVPPLRLFIFGDIDMLISTAWPVLALVINIFVMVTVVSIRKLYNIRQLRWMTLYLRYIFQTDINECESRPCLNGATCVNKENDYQCSCIAGYTGTKCEINIDECDHDTCQNGGRCIDGINVYSCHCRDGFSGDNCQVSRVFCEDFMMMIMDN